MRRRLSEDEKSLMSAQGRRQPRIRSVTRSPAEQSLPLLLLTVPVLSRAYCRRVTMESQAMIGVGWEIADRVAEVADRLMTSRQPRQDCSESESVRAG